MFEIFKSGYDVYAEINGYDTAKMKAERMAKTKKAKRLLSKPVKVVILIVGILYLLLSVSNISLAMKSGNDVFIIVKHGVLCVLDMAVIFSLFFKGRKAELFAIFGVAIFILANYVSSIIANL